MPTASKIMIVRHGEKPPSAPPPQGIQADGSPDPESLIVQGWQRAGALATLFDPGVGAARAGLAQPNALFASNDAGGGSKRPIETITPLAARLSLSIDSTYGKKDPTPELVDAVIACSGTVLICWQHEDIPDIANHILGNTTTVPQKWPGDRFDVVWIFTLDTSSGTYAFSQTPQLLLAGDLPTGIS